MKHFLIVFDRSKGAIIRHRPYPGRVEALEARFAAEREFRDDPNIEVVVLGGSSWAAVQKTHARYFKRLGQLTTATREDARRTA
jgi:hypothetical protein